MLNSANSIAFGRSRGITALVLATLVVLGGPQESIAQVRKIGPEFRVNAYVRHDQIQPRVEALTEDSCVIVWLGSNPKPGGSYGIWGQFVHRVQGPQGAEFLITTAAELDQRLEQHPSVATAGNSGFVVAWESYEHGDEGDIGTQSYGSDGVQVGEAVTVNDSPHAQQRPTVAATATGEFAVVWTDKPTLEEFSPRTRVRVFDSDGFPRSDEFGVTLNGGWSHEATVAAQTENTFVVVWQEDGAGILGQRVDLDGNLLDAPFPVSISGDGHPAIAIGTSGSFVVVWESDGTDGDGAGIFGQRFLADTTPIGEPFQVNTYTTAQQALPSIEVAPTGEFIVLWESFHSVSTLEGGQDGSGRGVFGQLYDADGQRIGIEFQVNTFTLRDQGGVGFRGSDVAAWSDRAFVATWASEGQDGFDGGVYAQLFTFDPQLGALCGDANSDLVMMLRDSLHILRGSVGLSECQPCVCDVDMSGAVATTDALAVLRAVVGLESSLVCSSCDPGS
jgi:hypothetical protein